MWWWRKVRRASISEALRDELELIGETVIAGVLVVGSDLPTSPLYRFATKLRPEAESWLTERRDIEARHDDRVETVEWAILIFVVIGVVMDALLVVGDRALSREMAKVLSLVAPHSP